MIRNDVNPAHLAYLAYLASEEVERQKAVAKQRAYHEGDHETHITDRLKEFLSVSEDAGDPFRLNVARIVVTAVEERLEVIGFEASDESDVEDEPPAGDEMTPADELAGWAWDAWQANRMDGRQSDVHEGALRDGEYFVIVDWDAENDRPRFTPHQRYVDPQYDGDGFGCKAHYPADDDTQPMEYASKRWTEHLGGGKTRQRMTLYYPDRVERYVIDGGVPKPLDDDEMPVVQPWRNALGQPLGIPVIHFKNRGLRPEAKDALPVQDAINKTLIDLIATADLTAFRIFVAFGWHPTTDGKPLSSDGDNRLNIAPGNVIGSPKSPQDASLDTIEPAELTSLIDLMDKLLLWLAMITDTPISRFTTTRQVAAEDTLKQQETTLLAKIKKRHLLFGNAWEDCMYMARRLANFFGTEDLAEEVILSALWETPETRDEGEFLEGLALKRERLGVPLKQVWAEAGYSQAEIEAMLETEEMQTRNALASLALNGNEGAG